MNNLKSDYEQKVQDNTEKLSKIESLQMAMAKMEQNNRETNSKYNTLNADFLRIKDRYEEINLENDKNISKIKEFINLQQKLEDKNNDLEKQLLISKKSNGIIDSELKRLQDEIVSINILLKEKTLKLETEISEKLLISNELNNVKQKLSEKITENQNILSNLEEKTDKLSEISNIIHAVQDYQDNIRRAFRDTFTKLILSDKSSLLSKELNNFSSTDLSNTPDCTLNWFESLKTFMLVLYSDLEKIINNHAETNNSQLLATRYISELEEKVRMKNEHETMLVETESTLRLEIDREKMRSEHLQAAIDSLGNKLKSSELSEKLLSQKISELSEQKNSLENKLSALIEENANLQQNLSELSQNAKNNANWAESLEQKVKQVVSEKKDYEDLLMKIHSNAPTSGTQKIIRDLMFTQKDLHNLQRDAGASSSVDMGEKYEKRHTEIKNEIDKMKNQIHTQLSALKDSDMKINSSHTHVYSYDSAPNTFDKVF